MLIYLFLFFTLVPFFTSAQESFPGNLSGTYLGQKLPGDTPEIFAPFLKQEGFTGISCVFSPDGKEFMYSISPISGNNSKNRKRIYNYYMKLNDSKWSAPVEFLSTMDIIFRYPYFTKNGRKIFLNATGAETKEYKIPRSALWQTERSDSGWYKPKEVILGDATIDKAAIYPSLAANGNLYFASFEADYKSYFYMSRFIDGSYTEPERLAGYINNSGGNHPFIASDESYILFDSENGTDNLGKSDLYISFRDKNGKWQKPINLGGKINTRFDERRAFLSDDGKYLFFVSDRKDKIETGIRDFYWVDASFIENLRRDTFRYVK